MNKEKALENKERTSENNGKFLKRVLWILFYGVSILSYGMIFPLFVFTFYICTYIFTVLFFASVIVLSVLAFKKCSKKNEKKVKILLACVLSLPIILFILILTSYGWRTFFVTD